VADAYHHFELTRIFLCKPPHARSNVESDECTSSPCILQVC